MLRIVVPAGEMFDDARGEFVYQTKDQTLILEHSLVSLSKWEAKTRKPFLSKEPMSRGETLEDIRCMTGNQNVDPLAYYRLTEADLRTINDYIQEPMTATWFSDRMKKRNSREVVTAEIIYYWMIALEIPFECQKWHLNRLLTLIGVCNEKNQKPKNMSRREIMSRNAALNAARRKAMGSRG